MKNYIILIIFAFLASNVSIHAVSLEKRQQLCIKVGIWKIIDDSQAEIQIGKGDLFIRNSGLVGGISFGHWLKENMTLTISANSMAFDFTSSTSTSDGIYETATVTTILLGFKHYFLHSSQVSSVRPYLKVGVGPYVGSQSSDKAVVTDLYTSKTELSVGGQIGIGTDLIVSRHFMFGVVIDYNLMADFNEPIGGNNNFNGPEFIFELSWLLGNGI